MEELVKVMTVGGCRVSDDGKGNPVPEEAGSREVYIARQQETWSPDWKFGLKDFRK